MTLVVGGVNARVAWIVSDTLITGGTIQLREREYQIKCIPSKDRQALIAFSGDAHNGARLIEEAAALPANNSVAYMLAAAQADNPKLDFLYALRNEDGPLLFKISAGAVTEAQAAYAGEKGAFEAFQRIRHTAEIEPVPKAVEQFLFGTRAPSEIPAQVSLATVSMLRLFMQKNSYGVGGWAVPYVLADDGAYMCGYAHSYSDPILDKVLPGSVVPHGTAEAGGYGLSVTELGQNEGMVVYRRQLPGGVILVRQVGGYKSIEIPGRPSEFLTKAQDAIGKPVDIFFSDAPLGTPESITIVRDEQGVPAFAIAKRGRNFAFSVLNVQSVFKASAELNLASEQRRETVMVQNLTLTLVEDGSQVILRFVKNGNIVEETTLNADELDNVITALGEFRASLAQQVSKEPDKSGGRREVLAIDPVWRTERSPYDELGGIVMRLRHPGLGWVSFLLPPNECKSLGQWLSYNSGQPDKPSAPVK